MIWLPLLAGCLHGPPDGPTPAARAAQIHTPLLVETNRSHVGLSLLVRGGSAADPIGKEGVGALLWDALSTDSALEAFKSSGGQFRSEWRRDYGAFHYRWGAGKEMTGPLLDLLSAQLNWDANSEEVRANLQSNIEARDTREADEGLPSLLDAWLQLGLAGHPYAHPAVGNRRSRANIDSQDLASAAARLFCTGNLHVAVSDKEKPKLPIEIADLLNARGPCSQEPPTPKPLPLAQGPRLLILHSRAAGSHAFVGLPHRSTSHPTNSADLAWGAALLDNGNEQGPIHRALAARDIEALVKVRLSPNGERWKQPLLMVEVRSQDADPVQLFKALSGAVLDLETDGWSPRDHHRLNQHLSNDAAKPGTQLRLESRLLAEVFSETPKAEHQSEAQDTLEALHEGILLERLTVVMQVGESEALAEVAQNEGFQVEVLRAEDFIQAPDLP